MNTCDCTKELPCKTHIVAWADRELAKAGNFDLASIKSDVDMAGPKDDDDFRGVFLIRRNVNTTQVACNRCKRPRSDYRFKRVEFGL